MKMGDEIEAAARRAQLDQELADIRATRELLESLERLRAVAKDDLADALDALKEGDL